MKHDEIRFATSAYTHRENCKGCHFENTNVFEYPCKMCSRLLSDKFKQKDTDKDK